MEEFDVAMAVVRNSGQFLALEKADDYRDYERYRQNPLETAGGKIEQGEDPVRATERELMEETGLRATYAGPDSSPDSWKFSDKQPGKLITFYPVPLEAQDREAELSEEHSDFFWLTRDKFEEKLSEHNVEGLKKVLGEFEKG